MIIVKEILGRLKFNIDLLYVYYMLIIYGLIINYGIVMLSIKFYNFIILLLYV